MKELIDLQKGKRSLQGRKYYSKNKEKIIKRQKEYYENNKDKVKSYQKKLRDDKPEKALFNHARRRARSKGLQFTISRGDIIVPKMCPLLEIPIYVGDNALCDNSPTLDRIDNNHGYVAGNIQVISYKANRMKSNSSFCEFEKIYLNWKKQGDYDDSL